MYYKTGPFRLFNAVNIVFLIAVALLCVAPMAHIFAVSLSARSAANANLVGLWPIGWTIDAYVKTIANPNFLMSLWKAAERTVLGTLLSMLVIVLAAYPLAKSNESLKGKKWITWYFVFTMLFSGGLIPTYMLVYSLGLKNSVWALVLPGAVPVFSLILLLNFFRNVPDQLEDAAMIDGAGPFATLFHVILPVSLPAIATLSLFSMVTHWNSWFDGLIYLSDYRDYPLATYMQTVVIQNDFTKANITPSTFDNLSQRSVKAAQIFIGALPILLVYPLLQRYFVKGIVLGAVKE